MTFDILINDEIVTSVEVRDVGTFERLENPKITLQMLGSDVVHTAAAITDMFGIELSDLLALLFGVILFMWITLKDQ